MKIRTTIMIDDDVIAHFRELARNSTFGYQTLINAELRKCMRGYVSGPSPGPKFGARSYEEIMGRYEGCVLMNLDKPVVEIAVMVADTMGISVQMVQEACALVTAARAARGELCR